DGPQSRQCQTPFPYTSDCSVSIQMEFDDEVQSSSSTLAFSYILVGDSSGTEVGMCGNFQDETAAILAYGVGRRLVACGANEAGSIVLASNFLGQVRILYEVNGFLASQWFDGTLSGAPEVVGTVSRGAAFSAVSDDDYSVHVLFNAPDTTTTYSYLAPVSGASWTSGRNIFPGSTQPATITLDHSTGDLYAFATNGSSIVMKVKPPGEAWSDGSMSFQITGRN